MMKRINLQLFGEEVSSAGTTDAVGVTPADATQEAVVENHDDGGEETSKQETQDTPTFEDLINGEHKDAYKKHMNEVVQKRLKKVNDELKEAKERADKFQPALAMLSEKYGVDATDIEALTEAIENDRALYEEKAMERGMDVDTYMQVSKMERENARLREAQQQTFEEERRQRQWENIVSQAEELKEIYPSFDLDEEFENEQMLQLVVSSGVPLKTAFEVVHNDELQSLKAKAITDKAVEKVTNAVKANAKRPTENGLKNQQGNQSSLNPATFTAEQINDYKRRALSGEKISF